MPSTDLTALLHSLHDTGTNEANDEHDDSNQQERIKLRQKATEVGLVVHAATDPDMLRSLITRKAFIDQRAADTMKPAEIKKQQQAFSDLQAFGAGIIEATMELTQPGDGVDKHKTEARDTFEQRVLKSALTKDSDAVELAVSVFEESLDAVTERLHDKSDGAAA